VAVRDADVCADPSRALAPAGADVRFVHGSVAEVVGEFVDAAAGQNVWVVGGGDVASQFSQAGLLDEVWVQIAPVARGAGRPLFTRALNLELVELARINDFVCAHYRVQRTAADGHAIPAGQVY